LYKTTGQSFTLVSFKLDPKAEKENLLTLNQLQNSIRLSADRKEKICRLDSKILVLLVKEEPKNLTSLISKVKANLPSNDPNYLRNIVRYISVYAVKVDRSIQNAEDILQRVTSEEIFVKEKLNFH
jgi:hypothetical protein